MFLRITCYRVRPLSAVLRDGAGVREDAVWLHWLAPGLTRWPTGARNVRGSSALRHVDLSESVWNTVPRIPGRRRLSLPLSLKCRMRVILGTGLGTLHVGLQDTEAIGDWEIRMFPGSEVYVYRLNDPEEVFGVLFLDDRPSRLRVGPYVQQRTASDVVLVSAAPDWVYTFGRQVVQCDYPIETGEF